MQISPTQTQSSTPTTPSQEYLRKILDCLRNSEPQEVEKYFTQLLSEQLFADTMLVNSIAHGYCKLSLPEEGERFLNRLLADNLCEPNDVTYSTIMNGYGHKADYKACLRLLDVMKSKQIQPGHVAYLALITAYSKSSLPVEAEKVLRELIQNKNINLTIIPYNAVMNGYINNGQPLEAYRIFQELDETAPLPSEVTYKTIFRGLVTKYPFESEQIVMKILKEPPQPYFPEIRIINHIIDGYCKLSLPNEADRFLDVLMSTFSIKPNDVTYSTLMNGYAHEADHQACSRLFKDMKSKQIQPNLITYTALITAYSKSSLPIEAEKVLRELIGHGKIRLNALPYNAVMNGFVNSSQPFEAYRIYQELLATTISPNEETYQIMFRGLIPRHPREAKQVFLQLKSEPHLRLASPDLQIINQILDSYCKSSLPNEAEAFLNETITNYSIKPNDGTYTTLMNGYAHNSDHQACSRLLEVMKSKLLRLNLITYTALITAYSKSSLPIEAERVLRELIGHGKIRLNALPYNAVMNGFVNNSQPLEAYRIYQEFLATTISPNEDTYQIMFRGLKFKYPRETEQLLIRWKNHSLQPVDLSNRTRLSPPLQKNLHIHISNYALQADPSEVYTHMTNLITSGVMQRSVATYVTIIRSFIYKRDYSKVDNLLEEMKNNKMPPDQDTYETIIFLYCSEDLLLPVEAERKCLEARSNKITLKKTTYLRIFDKYLQQGEVLNAERFFRKVILEKDENGNDKISTNLIENDTSITLTTLFNSLLFGYLTRNSIEDMLRIFDEMRSKEQNGAPDVYSYRTLMRYYNAVDDNEKNEKLLFQDLITLSHTYPNFKPGELFNMFVKQEKLRKEQG